MFCLGLKSFDSGHILLLSSLVLTTSIGCQDALEKQISDNIALDSIGVKKDESATSSFPRASSTPNYSVSAARGSSPKLMTRKEFKKLRQRTRKRLANMQAKEADDISEGDDDLNNSVEALIDPTKNQLDPKDNFDDDSNNNTDPLAQLTKTKNCLVLDLRESTLPDNPPHWGTGVSRRG